MGTQMSGRRIPRAAKIIRGTFRRDRNPGNEPEPPLVTEVPEPPDFLGKVGRQLWKDLARSMVEAGILTTVDLPALEILCSSYETFREARAAIYRPGGKRRTLAAYLKDRPPRKMSEYTVMKNAWTTYRIFAAEFGLTPSARNRIDLGAPKKTEVDPMEALLDAP